ncbi:MAG: dihydroorotase [Acidobacteriota bacterium]|nr:dihydroorotase [Acidobacteriota bacterium]
MKLLLKNGRLIDPATAVDAEVDILIEEGKIAEISGSITTTTETDTIDIGGLVISPGFIDIHVHLREPGQEHKETIAAGSRAAVAGGFTSIACMPNTAPVNDNPSVTSYILLKAEETQLVNIFPVAAVSRKLEGNEPVDMEALYKAGVKGFSDDGWCVTNRQLFREALKTAKNYGLPIIEHPEEHSMTGDGQINKGKVSQQYGFKGIPAAAEDVIVARDIQIQEEIKGKLHLTHLSTRDSLELVREAKKKGVVVTCDVTPHHLLLTEDLIAERLDAVYKMKPPLRTEIDRLALVEGIKTGIVDCIASDHAPHSLEEKSRPFEKAPFGVIGMETSFPVIYDRLVRTGIIDIQRLIELFSTNPARVLNLEGRGMVKPGCPADLTILDLNRSFKINAGDFYSKSVNCPFIGWEGKGVVAYTIVNGKIVYTRT